MRLIPYVRVSRVNGRDPLTETSAPDQRRAIEGLANVRGFDLTDWIEDLDLSGGTYERPGFQEALRMVEAGEADGIIVARLDRFARSLIDGLRGMQRIDTAKGHFVSVAESFDTTTPMGRAMLQISLVFAELERSRIAENWVVQKRDAVDRGVHMHRHVPYGYRRNEDGILEVHEAEAEIVRDTFRRRAARASWLSLVNHLNTTAPRACGGAWTPTNVRGMIRKRVYLGEVGVGDLVNKDAHPAILGRSEWEAAQDRDKRAKVTWTKSLLGGGTLICSGCGRPMTHGSGGTVAARYGCQRYSATGRCPKPVQVTAALLDAHVTELFLDWAARQSLGLDAKAGRDDAHAALQALESAEAELVAYRDANLVTVIGRDAYVAGLEGRAKVIEAAKAKLNSATAHGLPVHGFDLVEDWETMPIEVKRAVIAAEMTISVLPAPRPGSRAPVADRIAVTWLADGENQVRPLAALPS